MRQVGTSEMEGIVNIYTKNELMRIAALLNHLVGQLDIQGATMNRKDIADQVRAIRHRVYKLTQREK